MAEIRDKNLYYVGGVVRDEILGVPSFDTDYCYEGNAIEFAKKHNLNIIKKNPDFGTVRVLFDEKEIDIASTRKETYPKAGHLPKVTDIGCCLEEDLKRRDFTINAIAKNTVTGEIIDCFGGLEDIKDKKIKILHDNSFKDDPTRIIRALKFSVRFGFELEEHTKKLQEDYLNNINFDMSIHRLKKELIETFNLNSADAFDKFKKQNIWRLLGKSAVYPKNSGAEIKKAVGSFSSENIWLIYLNFFGILESEIPFTRKERTILEWAEKLKNQPATNNNPKESIIINSLTEKQ